MIDLEWAKNLGRFCWRQALRFSYGVEWLLVGLIVALCLIVGTGCVPQGTEPTPRVVVWGDSFGEQVRPHLPYETRAFGGTAPCDWLQNMVETPLAPNSTAVLVFVGNKYNAGCDYAGAVAGIEAWATSLGVRTVWIAAPLIPVYQVDSQLNSLYPHPCYGPRNAIGGNTYISQFRAADGQHLSVEAAHVYAQQIQACVG